MKRTFDFIAASLGLICLAPVLSVVALISLVKLGRPIFFKQKRIGKDGEEFELIKFRTMSNDDSLSESQRLSSYGKLLRKLSIDELPELWNVVKGDMSLVGPRPLLVEYRPYYSKQQWARHSVRPGITGLAQISGRNSISWDEKFHFDLSYVENHSFWGDIVLIFKTLWKVVAREGVNSSQELSMQRFDRPITLVGAGGHAKVVRDIINACGYRVDCVMDDSYDGAKNFKDVNSFVSPISDRPGQWGVLGIGDNNFRRKLASRLAYNWKTFIHPTALVHESAVLGEGCVVMAGAQIGPDARIGRHTIINTNAVVEHDCFIGDFVHIAPGSVLCGAVRVESDTLIGAASVVIPGKIIGRGVVVGAASVVIKNIESYKKYAGNPAKELSVSAKGNGNPLVMAKPEIDEADVAAVAEVVRSGHLSLGPKVLEFEAAFCDYIGVKHALAVSSGTTALHLIVKAMGIGPGDEVLVPSFTFVSSVNAILFEGATPVFVDIDPTTHNVCVSDLEKKVTDKTKAILAVDVFGHPADWQGINRVAKKYKLWTIDDSCEALGAKLEGQMVGTFADASTFAFYPNKQMTTGEGGMIVTDNDLLAEKMRSYRNQGRPAMGQWLEHTMIGYNYRLSDIASALGITQLAKIDSMLANRAEVANWYNKEFSDFKYVSTQVVKDNVDMSWFVYVVKLDKGLDRDRLIQRLADQGVPARAYFNPIHVQPYLKDYAHRAEGLEHTLDTASRTLALPFHGQMDVEQVKFVVNTVKSLVMDELDLSKARIVA